MLLLFAAALAADGFVLPPGEPAEPWRAPLALADLTVAPEGPIWVTRADQRWHLYARGPDGAVRDAWLPAPVTASDREAAAFLARSLLVPLVIRAPSPPVKARRSPPRPPKTPPPAPSEPTIPAPPAPPAPEPIQLPDPELRPAPEAETRPTDPPFGFGGGAGAVFQTQTLPAPAARLAFEAGRDLRLAMHVGFAFPAASTAVDARRTHAWIAVEGLAELVPLGKLGSLHAQLGWGVSLLALDLDGARDALDLGPLGLVGLGVGAWDHSGVRLVAQAFVEGRRQSVGDHVLPQAGVWIGLDARWRPR
jgi:hypothetical protein